MAKRVSIKFCGSCNARIDCGAVAGQLRRKLMESGCEVSYGSLNADSIIFLSGCRANCAARYNPSAKPSVAIAGLTVDAETVDEQKLADVTAAKILHILTGPDKRE
mgnify:CR=1 FL=1